MEGLSKIQVQFIRIESILVVNMELEGLGFIKEKYLYYSRFLPLLQRKVPKKFTKRVTKLKYKLQLFCLQRKDDFSSNFFTASSSDLSSLLAMTFPSSLQPCLALPSSPSINPHMKKKQTRNWVSSIITWIGSVQENISL